MHFCVCCIELYNIAYLYIRRVYARNPVMAYTEMHSALSEFNYYTNGSEFYCEILCLCIIIITRKFMHVCKFYILNSRDANSSANFPRYTNFVARNINVSLDLALDAFSYIKGYIGRLHYVHYERFHISHSTLYMMIQSRQS